MSTEGFPAASSGGEGAPGRRARAARIRIRAVAGVGTVLTVMLSPLFACNSKTIALHSDQVASLVSVSKDLDLDAGLDGHLEQFLSTAFQPAVWQSQFFDAHPDEQDPDASALAALGGQHVLVQVQDPPWKLVSPGTVDWDFAELDAIVGPLMKLGLDPVLQLNQAPSAFKGSFASYCASLVRYYNGDGVSLADGGVARSTVGSVHWWGIWSDSNTTNPPGVLVANVLVSGTEFAHFYNDVVSAMRAVNPTLRFAAPEYNDCTEGTNPCRRSGETFLHFIPDFLATTEDGGASAAPTPVDALSVHMFATSYATPDDAGLSWSDRQVFDTVPLFEADIRAFRTALVKAGRADTRIWVTENQVNSDVPAVADGTSVHAARQEGRNLRFHADARGTSAFFAAWRPALFSRLGKAGNQGLFQWEFTAGHCPDSDVGNCSHEPFSDTDPQNAEVDYQTGKKYLSYWVDYWLAHKFAPGGSILQADSQDPSVEVLATSQPSAAGGPPSTVVMVVNATVASTDDKNGPGARRTVIVDLRALLLAGATTSPRATLLMIDARTDLDAGPVESPVSPSDLQAGWVPVTFGGYGVAFLTLAGSTVP